MEDQFGNKELYVPCTCGCTTLRIHRYKEDGDWWISSYVREMDSLQQNVWRTFVHRFKLMWNIFRGKEYWFYDIVVSDKNMQEFMDYVKDNM